MSEADKHAEPVPEDDDIPSYEEFLDFLHTLPIYLRNAKLIAAEFGRVQGERAEAKADPGLFLALHVIDRHALALSAALAILADRIANGLHADETPAPEPEPTPDTPDAPEPFAGWSGVAEGGTA